MKSFYSFMAVLFIYCIVNTGVAQSSPPHFTYRSGVIKDRQVGFEKWKSDFRIIADRNGIHRELTDRFLQEVKLNDEVIRLDRRQPEFITSTGSYIKRAVSDTRVRRGIDLIKKHGDEFHKIEDKYKVPVSILVSIWGIESLYGQNYGSFNVLDSLATLSYDGRRKKWANTQLLAVLHMLQDGRLSNMGLKGSWAGAMGHTQFIPSTFADFAVDHTNDGIIDFWGNDARDALASAANYLMRHGWVYGEPWGIEVRLPKNIDYSLLHQDFRKPVSFWENLGIMSVDGKSLPKVKGIASVIIPGGSTGPAFMIFKNFHVIKKYNNSTSYAIAVGHLADRVIGRSKIRRAWDDSGKSLAISDVVFVQRYLADKGFYSKKAIDGIIGSKTKTAVREYQKSRGLRPDGHIGSQLLKFMKHEE